MGVSIQKVKGHLQCDIITFCKTVHHIGSDTDFAHLKAVVIVKIFCPTGLEFIDFCVLSASEDLLLEHVCT